MNLEKLTIKTRLRGGLGVIIAFMVVLIIIGIWSLQNMNNSVKDHKGKQRKNPSRSEHTECHCHTIDKSVLVVCYCQ